MKNYSYFSGAHVKVWELATDLVSRLDVSKLSRQVVRCHELTRAVFVCLPDVVCHNILDGHFGSVEHSWIELDNGLAILDVDSVSRTPMVQLLVDPRPWPVSLSKLYVPGKPRQDIDVAFVRELARAMAPRGH
jgi:hypothetical protein